MEQLKPCPFCGGEAIFHQTSYGTTSPSYCKLTFTIRCTECGSTAANACGYIKINLNSSGEFNIMNDSRPSAILAWNRRAER